MKSKLQFILYDEFKNIFSNLQIFDLIGNNGKDIWESEIKYDGQPNNIRCYLTGKKHMSNINGKQIVFFLANQNGNINLALDPNIFIFKKQLCDIVNETLTKKEIV